MSLLSSVASLPQTALNLINSRTKTRANASLTNQTKNGVKAKDSTSGTTPPPSTAAQATTDIGSTFLSLLTKELQNQDPTAPMDSTAMVGQMISLNQLDQLISINSALNPTSTATSTGGTSTGTGTGTGTGATGKVSGTGSGQATSSAATLAATQALMASASPSTSSANAAFNSGATLNAAAAAASNAATLNLSNLNSMFGGK